MSGLRLYRPSNGSEGGGFIARFCERCTKDAERACDILIATMIHDVDDPEYPREWVTDDESGPRCTAFTAKDSQ